MLKIGDYNMKKKLIDLFLSVGIHRGDYKKINIEILNSYIVIREKGP